FGEGMMLTLRTLTFGPLRDLPEPLWPWLAVAALLPLLGVVALVRSPQRGKEMTVTSESDSHLAPQTFREATVTPERDSHLSPYGVALALWLLAPIALMFALGLFSDAFLKFLLTASPAWTLLCAAAPLLLPRPRWGAAVIALAGIALAVSVLPTYYTSPT